MISKAIPNDIPKIVAAIFMAYILLCLSKALSYLYVLAYCS